jgi:RHS repeat-associated protein
LNIEYQYDANGNRTNIGYQTGTNNQLLADGQFTYQYDQEGNRTKRTEIATGKVTEYVWDYHNRLAQVLFKDASGAVTKSIEYTYDVNNQRIGKKIDGVVTERYVIDQNQIALVFDGSGVQKSRYFYGTQIDQVLAEESDPQVHWFLADNQGTVKDVVDNTGAVIDHITYDSFGRIVSQTSPVDLRFAYTGREWDGETSQYYYRARYYDAAVGKFIGEDPIGFSAEDTNLSRYVGNSATNFIDPSGYAPVLDRPPVITPISPVVNGGAQSFGSKVLGLGSKILRVGGPAIGLLTDLVFPQPLSDGTLRRNRKPTPLPQPLPSPSTTPRPYGPPERPIPIERMTDREIERMLDKRLRDIQNQGNPTPLKRPNPKPVPIPPPAPNPNECPKENEDDKSFVPIYKAPQIGMADRLFYPGFSYDDFSGNGFIYFAKNKFLADDYASRKGGYDGRVLQVNISKKIYQKRFIDYEKLHNGDPTQIELEIPASEIGVLNSSPKFLLGSPHNR